MTWRCKRWGDSGGRTRFSKAVQVVDCNTVHWILAAASSKVQNSQTRDLGTVRGKEDDLLLASSSQGHYLE